MRNFEKKVLNSFSSLRREELKRIMERLFKERNMLQGGIDALPAVFVLLSNKGEILYANYPAKIFFKRFYLFRAQAKLEGKNLFSLIRHEAFLSVLRAFFKDRNTAVEKNLPVLDKAGNPRELSLWLFPSRNSSKQNSLIIFDITAWKEKNLKEEQESSILSLNLLTSGIAHEIKNPLGALDLHLQLVKRFLKNYHFEGKEKIQELIKIINDEITRLDHIVNDFLTSFKPRKPIKKLISLNEIVLETLEVFRPRLDEKKVKFFLALEDKIAPYPFDKDQLKQVILNLLENSLEAIAEVEAPGAIYLSTKQKEQKVIFSLRDNGIGVEKTNLKNLFRPFQTTKKMGTGLGLSIVARLVREHGGEIIFNSSPKKGTEVIIEFDPRLPLLRLLENKAPLGLGLVKKKSA